MPSSTVRSNNAVTASLPSWTNFTSPSVNCCAVKLVTGEPAIWMDRFDERLLIAILTSVRLSSASETTISDEVRVSVAPSSTNIELPNSVGGSLTASKVTSRVAVVEAGVGVSSSETVISSV